MDTNFVLTCVKMKIPFVDRLREEGFKVVVPKEVMEELKDLRRRPASHEQRVAIGFSLKMLENNKNVKHMTLGGKTVDASLIELGKKGAYIATLDGGIRRVVPNKILISDIKRDILIERS